MKDIEYCECILAWQMAGLAALLAGCAGRVETVPDSCAQEQEIFGECVGVTPRCECTENVCAGSIPCSDIVEVHDDAELSAALAAAGAGTCLALREGTYPMVHVPAGVGLIGARADDVQVEGVELATGGGVRGVTVGADRIVVAPGASGALVECTRVAHASGPAIAVQTGGSAAVRDSEIDGGEVGALASDAAVVTIESSTIAGAGRGIQAACDGDAAARGRPP